VLLLFQFGCKHSADLCQGNRLRHLYVLAIDIMDCNLTANVRFPSVRRGSSFALPGRKKQDISIKRSRAKRACEPAVVSHDLD
jgi:hypothetical protein